MTLAMLALLIGMAPTPQQPGLELIHKAEYHFAAGEFTAAAAAFKAAAPQMPGNTYSQKRLAALYLQWNRPTEGLAVWAATPDGDPMLQLQLLAAAGEWEALETAAQKTLQSAQADESVYAWLTQALLHQSRCREAESAATTWEQQSASVEATLTAAILRYTVTPNTPETEICALDQELCTATQGCANTARCMQQLGERLLRQRRPELAACALAQAAEHAPEDANIHAWLGASLEQSGNGAAALLHFQEATALAPDSALGWLLLGIAQLDRQNITVASEALLHAQSLDPGNPAPCLAMAAVLAAQSNYTNIPVWTTAALERAPEDPEMWKAAARFYLTRNLALGEEPHHAAAGAVQLAPEDAEAWMLLGWAQFNTQDFNTAWESLQTALTYDPKHPEIYHLLGLTLRALGRDAEAETALIRAQDLGYQP